MAESRKRIRLVTPIVTEGFRTGDDLGPLVGPDTEVSVAQIVTGPASIESELDEALAVPDTLRLLQEAEREGVGAVVIDCMGDPGLKAAREIVSIPVLGPAETSMHLAAMLGHRFSVVTVMDRIVPMFENSARLYGVAEKLASVRSVEIPVLDLERDPERLVEALVEESRRAIEEDGAHVIIFGCTGMLGCAARVEEGLLAAGRPGVPVIDPVPAALRVAAALLDLGLTQSKLTYPAPPAKRIVGFPWAEPAGMGAAS
jgi:allantoin racemase